MNDRTEFVDLGTGDPNVIGLKVTGKVTAETISQLVERLESIRASRRKARLYLDLANFEGYELPVVKEKLAHMGTFWNSIERCAYVIDKAWMSTVIGLIDAVTPMHLRAFGTDQDAEARAWVLSEA
ncbi:MAG: STAS/SEC14 domain-containing protein [Pseudomonadota bacterium]|nr:STAS/SEC14 domain-containing protein [Pseudomonadota bacterium]